MRISDWSSDVCSSDLGDEAAEGARVQSAVDQGVARPVPGKDLVRHQRLDRRRVEPACSQLGARLLGRLAAHQRPGLREAVGDELQVMVAELFVGRRRQHDGSRDAVGYLVQEIGSTAWGGKGGEK